MTDPHTSHELHIFSQFVSATGLSVLSDSIIKCPPPAPDILCRVDGRGEIAFELVEIIDESMARRNGDALRLQQLLGDTVRQYPEKKRAEFLSRYQHSSILMGFDDEAPYKVRAEAVPAILDLLLSSTEPITDKIYFMRHREDAETVYRSATLSKINDDHIHVTFPQSPSRTPFVLLKRHSPLLNRIKWLMVSHYTHLQGPLFDVSAAGSFGEPALKRIQKKFQKQYSTNAPIELLAFYETQPVLPEDLWLPQLSSFIEQSMAASPFRGVWIFDAGTNRVLFHYPGVADGVKGR